MVHLKYVGMINIESLIAVEGFNRSIEHAHYDNYQTHHIEAIAEKRIMEVTLEEVDKFKE